MLPANEVACDEDLEALKRIRANGGEIYVAKRPIDDACNGSNKRQCLPQHIRRTLEDTTLAHMEFVTTQMQHLCDSVQALSERMDDLGRRISHVERVMLGEPSTDYRPMYTS